MEYNYHRLNYGELNHKTGYFKYAAPEDFNSPEFWNLADNGKFLKEIKSS